MAKVVAIINALSTLAGETEIESIDVIAGEVKTAAGDTVKIEAVG